MLKNPKTLVRKYPENTIKNSQKEKEKQKSNHFVIFKPMQNTKCNRRGRESLSILTCVLL